VISAVLQYLQQHLREHLRYVSLGIAAAVMVTTAAATASAATRIWDGGGADNNWLNAVNWTNDQAPVAGDDLLFPAGVADTTTVNNFPVGTKFGVIAFNGPYTVEGTRILIGSTIAHLGSGEVTFHADITLEGGQAALGTITFNVDDTNASLLIDGNISGPGGQFPTILRKNGQGVLRLAGSNTYLGTTAIEEGELRIHHVNALGAVVGNTVVSDGGVLGIDMDPNYKAPMILEPLMLAGQGTALPDDGALVFRRPVDLTGSITLFGAATPHIVVAFIGAGSQISGVIGGSNGFIKSGGGPLRLTGANTYTGMTTVAGHSLVLAHSQALGSPSVGTTVLANASLIMEAAEILYEPLFAQGNVVTSAVIYCLTPAMCTWGGAIVLQGENTFHAAKGCTLRLAGDISGSGLLDLTAGRVELVGTNTYSGDTFLGNVKLGGGNALPDDTYVEMSGGTMDLNGFSETIGALSGGAAEKVLLGASTLTIDMPGNILSSFLGTINGTGGLTKKGAGTFTIDNAQLYTGATVVQAGAFRMLSNTVLPGPITITGGTLRGAATIGGLYASGGRIEPGLSPGILTTQVLNLGSGSTLALELNGPTPGSEHDQVRVGGTIALNGATLEIAATAANQFAFPTIIVKNDGPSPVVGTFAALPEGATVFASNGRALRITYTGGDGNDIALTQGVPSYYLSEGATGAFFELDILIANPSATAVDATLTFLLPDGTTKVETRTVPGRSRLTVNVDDIAGLESTAVSTIVTSASGLPLIVERTMQWDASGYGAHTEKAVTSTSTSWYFAEGSQGFFSTYLLLANPGPSPNVATVRYLREGSSVIVRTYPVAANSRYTVDAGADPDLVGQSFGMHVTFEQPGVAERAMYFGADPFWKAGHESAGVIAPSPTWFLAEGATGPFFETFVLLANPGDQAAEATVTFLPDTGSPIVKTVPIPAQGRVTLNIEAEDPSLANAAVATQVSATQPILVERAQYWPDPAPQWHEAHNSFGVTAVGTKWGLAEGRSGGSQAYQTYILLANPGTETANVTISFLREGQGPVERTYTVQPRSRFNVDTGLVQELSGLYFGATVTSDQPIAVERAMYSNANGQVWAAGTNATATPLP
jgi:autotransporter-associated beta strand protein